MVQTFILCTWAGPSETQNELFSAIGVSLDSRLGIPLELLVLNLANSNPKWCSISGLAIEGVHLGEMRGPGKATLVFSPWPPTCQRSMCAIGVNEGLVVDSSFCVSYLKQCDIDPMIGETLCMSLHRALSLSETRLMNVMKVCGGSRVARNEVKYLVLLLSVQNWIKQGNLF